MATTTLLSGVSCTIGGVDVSDQVATATLTIAKEALENTSLGSTARTYTAGLETVELSLEMYNSYGAGEVEATLFAQYGTSVTIVISGTTSTVESPTNPEYTLSAMYLESFTPVSASYGTLQMVTAVYKGGPSARAIT